MNTFLVLGASPNPLRFSNKAIRSLVRHNKDVVAVGFREGTVAGIEIQKGFPVLSPIHTILLYMGEARQEPYLDYMVGLKPERVIINPGAESQRLVELLESNDIEVVEGCAMVMINTGQI